jgi:sugar lactone lactonase YvrE
MLYVTDSGLNADFTSSGTDAVYRFENGNPVAMVKGNDKLHGPNGLAVTTDGVFMVPFGGKTVYRIAPDGGMTEVAQVPSGGLDGIVHTGTGWLISSWEGQAVYRLDAQTTAAPALQGIESPADIGYDARRGRVLVPVFNQNRLEIRKR